MDTKELLINKVFPNIHENIRDHQWLSERAILAAKNVDVDDMNNKIQDMLHGKAISYNKLIQS